MTWGKSLLLAIPLILSGIFAVASPAAASTWNDSRTGWTSVSAGGAHTCGIRAGKLYCWGDNTYGQVGNGGDGHQDVPDDIGSSTDWTSVSTGAAHTCAIRARSLYCWGRNTTGQIGDGTTTKRPSPKRIGTSGVWALAAAGASHTCGITTGKSLYCWGNNATGQIGDGTTTPRLTPRRIGTAGAWTTAASGGTHTCAITTGKSLYCWGNNATGQIGDGTTTPRPAPRRIGTAGAWALTATGNSHTCAITTGKSLYCWGDNSHGQVYEPSATPRFLTPVRLYRDKTDYRQTDVGDRTSCAIRGAGILSCWGDDVGGVAYPTPGTANPASVPGFGSMTYWKLTAPVDDSGGTDGDAVEIKHPELATFKNPDYFHASSDNQKVYFRARVDGATTSGSSYPRSELREMKSNGSTNAAWSNATETHQMTITQAITHLPEARRNVVAGQIHGGSGDVLQIRLEGSRLFARFEGDSDLDQTLNSNYQLGTMFTVGIRADASGIAVAYTDINGVSKQVSHNLVATAPTWYFKAGCYTQSNDSVSNEPDEAYGEVLIDSVTITPVT